MIVIGLGGLLDDAACALLKNGEILAAVEADTPQAGARLAAVPEWFAAWEQSLSRFRPTSELSRLNAGAAAWARAAGSSSRPRRRP